jgi:hypothetical protein
MKTKEQHLQELLNLLPEEETYVFQITYTKNLLSKLRHENVRFNLYMLKNRNDNKMSVSSNTKTLIIDDWLFKKVAERFNSTERKNNYDFCSPSDLEEANKSFYFISSNLMPDLDLLEDHDYVKKLDNSDRYFIKTYTYTSKDIKEIASKAWDFVFLPSIKAIKKFKDLYD